MLPGGEHEDVGWWRRYGRMLWQLKLEGPVCRELLRSIGDWLTGGRGCSGVGGSSDGSADSVRWCEGGNVGGEGSGLHSSVAVEVHVSDGLKLCHVEFLCDLLQVSAGGASVQPARF